MRTPVIDEILVQPDDLKRRVRELGLEICALLAKPDRREVDIACRYVGFEIPNRFVVGYGLDAEERFRGLPYVATVDEARVGV